MWPWMSRASRSKYHASSPKTKSNASGWKKANSARLTVWRKTCAERTEMAETAETPPPMMVIPAHDEGGELITGGPRSLRELIDQVSGRNFRAHFAAEDAGLVEVLPFPFLAVVGQQEMKLALILALINPAIGGVLLIGPRGTGKTTAVRSLVDLLPQTPRSLCHYGCMPEDVETGGIDAVCPDCARKYAMGEPLA